jgi:UDPglucose 6-dehydrogenase
MHACADQNGQVCGADRDLIENNITVVNDCYAAADEAHAIAVLTEWDEFKQADFCKVYDSMHRPAFVFDGRNLLDRESMESIGFELHAIGKSPDNTAAVRRLS